MKPTSSMLLLGAAVAGIVVFLQGLRVIDTVGALVCGAVAGGALATMAAARQRGR